MLVNVDARWSLPAPLRGHAAQEHGPMLHLAFLGVLPSARASGLGARMLNHLAAMADTGGGW